MSTAAGLTAVAAAYLCGSIPFGLLIGLARGVDIRQHGSRNIGATNCGRVLGRRWGVLCFVLDVLKGAVPVAVIGAVLGGTGGLEGAMPTGETAGWWLAAAVAAVAGHIWPIWLKFSGGKGVATGFGAVLGVWPYLGVPAIGAALTWVALAALFRYVSLASVGAAVSLPLWFLAASAVWGWPLTRGWPMLAATLVMAAVVVVRHRANLARIRAGTEPRIGRRPPS